MVFHYGNHHLVALFQIGKPIAVCHKIYALCGVACKNYLLHRLRTDKVTHCLSCILIILRCLNAQLINSTERVCIVAGVKIFFSVNNAFRSLCSCSVVDINRFILHKKWKIRLVSLHLSHSSVSVFIPMSFSTSAANSPSSAIWISLSTAA